MNNEKYLPRKRESWPFAERDLFPSLQRQMNEMFNSFFSDYAPTPSMEPLSRFTPRVDIEEDENEYIVTAEVPGIEEKDIKVTFTNGGLMLRGEKHNEREEKGNQGRRYVERSFGSFERFIPLDAEIDEAKAEATFDRGIVCIHLPKSEKARKQARQIPLRSNKVEGKQQQKAA